ncbi:uncharacterized protein LOC105276853 isoform X2 [Ooceraea biroi]|uniref:Uncharacterized protein n=1 Tax=Ooceraea biroi TaxID=2015173 RepID=A0A026WNS3_OOCBI|nr:uncharacterized protein LOC105276853 isoform X2 [Ooceraea biroi]EZA57655.1 hypothetical protein X777_00755 [Ooceraea biroi]
MRTAAVWIAFILTCTSESFIAGMRYIDPQPGSNGDIGDKRVDLTEPSCDELRAMWRYTKRQSRAAKTTNGYPMYPPFYSNVWHNVAFPDRTKFSPGYRGRHVGRPRSRAAGGAPIYGRMVHKAPAGSRWRNAMRGPSRTRAFEEFSRQYGTVNRFTPNNRRITSFRVGGGISPPKSQLPQSGSFEALKKIIQAERARELQEQHVAEQMETEIAGKQSTDDEQEDAQQLPKHFFDPMPPVYEITPKVNYDNNQRRYSASNIPNFSMAWSRSGPVSREYVSP